jgi:hypothetical protein
MEKTELVNDYETKNYKIPKKNKTEKIKKMWYKFSTNTISVVGLGIVIFVICRFCKCKQGTLWRVFIRHRYYGS